MRLIRITSLALPLAALAFALLPALCGAVHEPRSRAFHMQYTATVKDIPEGAKHVDLWVPVPVSNEFQEIRNLRVESPYVHRIATAPNGNRVLHIGVDAPDRRTFTVAISFDATRKEHIQSRLFSGESPSTEEERQSMQQYLSADRLVPLDDSIRAWARDVVHKANAHTPLEMARAIYIHVVATVKYDKTGKGWGRGDIYYACDKRRGNCTDFHAIVIGYARAVGIPARFAIGLPLPAEHGEGTIAGYHCWAELYVKGIGWIPVDASEAAKNPAKREYFFGAHDENRIELSRGRDIVLVPMQRSEPLNYFVFPYVEVDGAPFAGATSEVSYRDTGSR